MDGHLRGRAMNEQTDSNGRAPNAPAADRVWLTAAIERRAIRAASGSRRHLLFTIDVAASASHEDRPSLALALVLDRSGSMSGDKLRMVKQAALAVVERLGSADRLALAIFDHETRVL